ncbi:glycosyltransferase [Mycobacterium sp. ML4]
MAAAERRATREPPRIICCVECRKPLSAFPNDSPVPHQFVASDSKSRRQLRPPSANNWLRLPRAGSEMSTTLGRSDTPGIKGLRMRIAIACVGTRGDALPLLEIAKRLRDAGHDVAFGGNADVAFLAERFGFAPVILTALDLSAFLASPEGQRAFFERGTVAQLRAIGDQYRRHSPEIDAALIELCRGTDCVITMRTLQEKVAIITAAADVPIVSLHLQPLSPAAPVAHPLVTPGLQRLPYPLSGLTYQLFDLGLDLSIWRDTRRLARRIGYPRPVLRPSKTFQRSKHLIVEAFGTAIVARNKRDSADCRRIGFIRPAGQHAPSMTPDLVRWIDATEEPLVYIGFGSTPMPRLGRLLTEFDTVCGVRGYRAIVAVGSSQMNTITAPSNRIRLVSEVDHTALFPRCAAVVHHGGAGTVAAAAASGTPSVVCSQVTDQYFWGRALRRLGAGELVPRGTLSAVVLADAVERVRADRVQHAAKRLAARIRGELRGADQFMTVFDEMIAGRTFDAQAY